MARCFTDLAGTVLRQSCSCSGVYFDAKLVDQLDLNPLAIEANLAHSVKDANGRSYNRTQYLAQRFTQIQQWADYLDKLRTGATVVPMHQRVA
jgi:hypothetical protein